MHWRSVGLSMAVHQLQFACKRSALFLHPDFWPSIAPVLTPFHLLLCKVYLNSWIVNLVLENFPPCLLLPSALLLFSQRGVPAAAAGLPRAFWPLLHLLSIVCMCQTIASYALFFFYALHFLSLTIFSDLYWKLQVEEASPLAVSCAIFYVVQGKGLVVEAQED